MTDRSEKAKRIFREGYNCAQSVLAAWGDEYGVDRDLAIKIAYGLGAGIARSRETCGAVLGAIMVLGLALAPENAEGKEKLYSTARSFMDEFRRDNGSVFCRELLDQDTLKDKGPTPEKRTEKYYEKRPCEELVGYAAELLTKYIGDE